MSPAQKQKIVALVAVVLLLAGAFLIVRPLLPARSDAGGVLDERARRGLSAAGAIRGDGSPLPPRGDMTDEEYARHLMQLREEADRRAGEDIEPGSARGPAEGG